MASLTIRNLPSALVQRIKAAARAAGRSMEQELRELLQATFGDPAGSADDGSPRCRRCGSRELEPGHVQSTGKVYFRPQNAKFLTLRTADILLHANICLACGLVELVGDVTKARALTERAQPH